MARPRPIDSQPRGAARLLGLGVLVVSVATCGGATLAPNGDGGDAAPYLCVPGLQIACPCLGGGSGVQVCKVDGSGYGTCECEDGAAVDASADTGRDGEVPAAEGGIDATTLADGGDAAATVGIDSGDGAADTGVDATTLADGGDAAATVGVDSGDGAADTGVDATIPPDGGDAGQTESGCTPSTLGCSGQQPQTCTAAGDWQDVGAPCSGSTPVCLGGGCVECAPGSTQCSNAAGFDGGVGVQTCSTTGHWQTPVACAQPTPDCSGGTCTCPGSPDQQTDINNCGGCGHACNVGPNPVCSHGACSYTLFEEIPEAGVWGPLGIAVDATNVYWTDGVGYLAKMPLGGGTPVILATGQRFPGASLAIDATSAYWVIYDPNGAPGGYALLSVPKDADDAGAVTTLAANFDVGNGSSAGPSGIVVDATNVYWTDNPGGGSGGGYGGTVFKCPIAGCGSNPTPLATHQNAPSSLALDSAGNLYWTNFNTGTVMRCATTGCGNNPAMISMGETQPMGITVNSSLALWADYGSVWVGPLDGGSGMTLVPDYGGTAIAADAVHAYVTPDTNGGSLMRVQIADGGTTPMVTLPPGLGYGAGSVALDSTYVYLVTSTGIMKVQK